MAAGAFPLGFGLTADDLARLMRQAPADAMAAGGATDPAAVQPQSVTSLPPFSFGSLAGPKQPAVTAAEFDRRFDASPPGEGYGLSASRADAMRTGLEQMGSAVPGQPPSQADMPTPNAIPAAGGAPAPSSAVPPASAPASPASASAPAAASPATPPVGEPGGDFVKNWKALADTGVGDQLLALSSGLLSGHGASGWAKGFENMQKAGATTAATDLARVKTNLEVTKATREQAQLTGNARYVMTKIPGISAEQAAAFGGNSAFMNELLKGALPPAELYKQYTDDEGNRWNRNERTGQETIALKAETDKSQTPLTDPEERAKAGIAPNDKRSAWSDPDGKITFNEGPKAQTSTMIGPDGTKATRVYNPATGTFDAPDYGGNPPRSSIDTSDVPPGVDPATYRKELAKGAAAERKGASAKAIQAADAMPILDRAETAYKRLGENAGIGPISASGPSRMVAGAFGRQNEIDRQEYEAAAKELELLKAQISMKGQGSITEGERHILRTTLPRLDAASPGTGLTTLQGMRDQFTRAMNADRLPSRGATSRGSDLSTPAQPAGQFGPIPGPAAQALQRDPSMRDQFDAKYGAGAADLFLKGR